MSVRLPPYIIQKYFLNTFCIFVHDLLLDIILGTLKQLQLSLLLPHNFARPLRCCYCRKLLNAYGGCTSVE